MGVPISPAVAIGSRDGDLPAYVSNGLVGLRVREVPLVPGMAIVSGVVGEHPERRIEAAAPVPYPLAGDLAIDRVWLSDQPWTVRDLTQAYDFETGELTSTFTFTVGHVTAEVEVLTFASRTAPAVVLQEVRIAVSAPCDLGLRARIDIGHCRGRAERRRQDTPGEPEPVCDGSMVWVTEGELSCCGLAMATELTPPAERGVNRWDESGPLQSEYRIRGTPSRRVRLRQMTAMVPSILHGRPDEEAVRRVHRARETGFDELRRRNRAAWADLWKGRVVAKGAPREHQAIIDAAFFYLNASVHPASPSATSIFGLATWHDYPYYFGHVMWDIDAFCAPFLILCQPDAARSLLDFRTRGRNAAGANARLSGRDGLQFPWEAAPRSGEECTPGGGSGAAHEDHVSLHVARAFSMFADIGGDEAFRDEDAWPILSGVADWIVSRVEKTTRGYELKRATGPAEVPDPPDNDAFTLMAMHDTLGRAVQCADLTGRRSPEAWTEVRAGLYLPRRGDGVIAAHDAFRITEPKGATPSPLAGLFPYDYPATETEAQRTLAFYLAHWRDYVGAPMFPALYVVWAAMTGDRALSRTLLEEGFLAYDHPRFHQCLEYLPSHADSEVRAGPFFANLGGFLMGVVYGLAGLSVDDGDPARWARRPVVLPQGWDGIEIERVWIRGAPWRLSARHGDERAVLTPL